MFGFLKAKRTRKTIIPIYRDFDRSQLPAATMFIEPTPMSLIITFRPALSESDAKSILGTVGLNILDYYVDGEEPGEVFYKKIEIRDAGLQPGFAEYRDAMAGMERDYARSERLIREENEIVLKQVGNLRGDDFLKDVKEYIGAGDGYILLSLSKGKAGVRQEVDTVDNSIKYEWVRQSCGPCGDDYYGDIYIHVVAGIYLKINFQC